jgi:hypothetical protein
LQTGGARRQIERVRIVPAADSAGLRFTPCIPPEADKAYPKTRPWGRFSASKKQPRQPISELACPRFSRVPDADVADANWGDLLFFFQVVCSWFRMKTFDGHSRGLQVRASVVLLGDSIFDNAAYVVGQSCVTDQLREILSEDIDVSMVAVDGHYVSDVQGQLSRVPEWATHLFVSTGGNDALSHYQMLMEDFRTSEDLFLKWSNIQTGFRNSYRKMLQAVTALKRHTTVCTIYDAVPGVEPVAITALSLFNDVIVSEAVAAGLPLIDLRQVCTEATDYSDISPIEPSWRGGAKIAAAVKRVFEEHDFSRHRSVVYTDDN